MNEITVLKVAPLCQPEVVTIQNDLRSLQEAVSIGADYVGLIEIVGIDAKTCILCNEEGKLIGLTPNRRLGYDILCGTFYVTGQDAEGNLASLPHSDVERYKHIFSTPDVISAEEVGETISATFCVW